MTANLEFYQGFDMRFFENSGTAFHDSITNGTIAGNTNSGQVVIDEGVFGRDVFGGANLGGIANNMPTAGSVSMWFYYADLGDGSLSEFWNFSFDYVAANTFSSFVLDDDVGTLFQTYVLAGSDHITGSDFDDGLLGYGGDDWISANQGDDYIDGGSGADFMDGGSGNNTFVVDNAGDTVTAGNGSDIVLLQLSLAGTSYTAPDSIENVRNVAISGAWLIGNTLNNALIGANGAADTLNGRDGDDVLNGGSGGGDAMYGGTGNDTFYVDNITDFVTDNTDTVTAGSGEDEVRSSITYTLTDAARLDIENLRLVGTAAINGTGNALGNVITGNSAANTLNGLGGADTMRGGDGNDIYYVDNSGDRVLETSASGGVDTIRSSITLTLSSYAENLQLLGSDAINGSGNALANRLAGNGEANLLYGRDGDDTLTGNGGNDALYGGNGADQLLGGNGEDWLEGGTGQDRMTGGADADMFVFRAGDLAGSAATCDRITDFSHAESDQIRLNAIDANSANGAGTNDAFTFIGTSAFHQIAGELRYQVINGNTYVYGDTDGNGVADIMIRLDGSHALVQSDFLL
ncbi:calcium-binding protein [Sphingomonas sabuli]|uniref:Calcium-binding protein n=1 Tax=Sphingomonas sabuli TaxID=2764186 RepID=A0A7G9KZ94_9SPHN|nr:calcium-binding protein [Sphingomonas sabuli]QNM81693.1 calcium-binding protein [Sphingomonas sabuli]